MESEEKIDVKNQRECNIIAEGGKILGKIKAELNKMMVSGTSAYDVEIEAERLMKKYNVKPSFKMVPGYKWATCVNVDKGIVHGIPKKEVVFRKGNLVSVDLGVYHKGFHTDSSFSAGIETDRLVNEFLETGRLALKKAVEQAQPGKRIWDISLAIEKVIKKGGYSPVISLVGHGVGRQLHESPQIPCFTSGRREETEQISSGMTFAIEVMYTMGSPNLVLENDGWTISTADGKISALFEDTVCVYPNGPKVLT